MSLHDQVGEVLEHCFGVIRAAGHEPHSTRGTEVGVYEDGDKPTTFFEIGVNLPPRQLCELESAVFASLAEKHFPIEESGQITIGLMWAKP